MSTPDPEAPAECAHSGEHINKFGGAIVCGQCRSVIGYWKPEQPTAQLIKKEGDNGWPRSPEAPKLDPLPWVASLMSGVVFSPRPEYSQNREDYPND